jgi:hypothetical protein
MKQHRWKTKRQLVACPDAQRGFDQAYQCLLSWTRCLTSSAVTEKAQQEESELVHSGDA